MVNNFKNTSVIPLSSEHFDDSDPSKLAKSFKDRARCSFVLYYSDNCGYCIAFKPVYINFAETCQFIKAYAVDTNKNKAMINKHKKFQIEGIPTVIMHKNGQPVKIYDGPRDVKSLNQAALDFCNEECKCAQ